MKMKLIEFLNGSSLETLNEVEATLQKRKQVLLEEQKKKPPYCLNRITKKYHYDNFQLHDLITAHFQTHSKLTEIEFINLEKQCEVEEEVEPSDIYTCPKCGKTSLEADIRLRRYNIKCTNCDFIYGTNTVYYYQAWKEFHDYLVRKGYLDK